MTRKLLLILFILFISIQHGFSQIYFEEDFEDGIKEGVWISVQLNENSKPWGWIQLDGYANATAVSGSFDYETGEDLYPNNWLISPVIDLTEASDRVILSYYIGAYDLDFYKETYYIYIKEEILESDTAYVEEFETIIQYETLQQAHEDYFEFRNINISDWIGKKIRLAFVHKESVGQSRLLLDNIKVEKSTDNADLSAESVLLYYNMFYIDEDIDVAIRLVNKGFATAQNVRATLTATNGVTFTENLPDLEAGGIYTHVFEQKIPGYPSIIENGIIQVTLSCSNETLLSNNTASTSFRVFPILQDNVIAGWTFEENNILDQWKNQFKLLTLDSYTHFAGVEQYIPNNQSFGLVKIQDPEGELPTEIWGETILIGSSSFQETQTKADRWVIFPKTYLTGREIALSWVSASTGVGIASPETFEVLISDKSDDPKDFTTIGTYFEAGTSLESPNSRILNISQYAGKEIYVAFRLISEFYASAGISLLAIDNVRLWSEEGGNNIEENIIADSNPIIYPNPVTDVLNLQGEIQAIEIFNQIGQTVYQERFNSAVNNYTVNMDSFPASFYVVKISTIDGKTYTEKIIKK